MKFCRRCGAALARKTNHSFVCKNGHIIYLNAAPAVGIFLVNADKEILIAKRAIEPCKGSLDSPGGFCDGAETLETALARELQEEIGISPASYSQPQFLSSGIDNYDFGGETLLNLSVMFWARIQPGVSLKPADDVAAVSFVPYDQLDISSIAFPAVRQAARVLQTILKKQ